ncbi:MAG: hypothetical protein FJW99_07770 [Actinobacteria bacterium]|nr:hypothetical protein [Actinomycetota bacterium]MBM3697132.1 hypothetical protein [Actinomycetota bacterium]
MSAHAMTPERAAPNLRKWNVALAILHAAQGVAILLLSNGFSLGITIPYMTGPPGSPILGGDPVWQVPIATFVAIFLFLAALDHLLCALPGIDRWYIANLGRGTNPLRWWEYSVSASLMIVLIALVSGIDQSTALIALFGANVGMILFGLAMEQRNPAGTEKVDWRPFAYGCITGAFPWIAIGLVLVRAQIDVGVPAAIWAIYISLFVLFFTFALNMWLHYARKGRWANIVSYEKTYLVLSLVAKSLLAWQIFASALAG